MLRIKRTYDPSARVDGRRYLVERLWPRGMTKDEVAADAWLKDVAPSATLRKWFDHRPERWAEFRRRYQRELAANPSAWEQILDAEENGPVTLLFSARDVDHNGAVVLRDFLAERRARRSRPRSHSRREPAPRKNAARKRDSS